jgi:hypothetical protein
MWQHLCQSSQAVCRQTWNLQIMCINAHGLKELPVSRFYYDDATVIFF